MSILSLLSSVLLTKVKCPRIIYSPARLSSTFSSLTAVNIRKQFTSVFSLEIPSRLDKTNLKFPQKAGSFRSAVQMISPRRILMLHKSSVGVCPRRYLIRLYFPWAQQYVTWVMHPPAEEEMSNYWQVVLIFKHTPTGLSLYKYGYHQCPNWISCCEENGFKVSSHHLKNN